MTEDGDIAIDDPMYRFCVSWYTIRVANVGLGYLCLHGMSTTYLVSFCFICII